MALHTFICLEVELCRLRHLDRGAHRHVARRALDFLVGILGFFTLLCELLAKSGDSGQLGFLGAHHRVGGLGHFSERCINSVSLFLTKYLVNKLLISVRSMKIGKKF